LSKYIKDGIAFNAFIAVLALYPQFL